MKKNDQNQNFKNIMALKLAVVEKKNGLGAVIVERPSKVRMPKKNLKKNGQNVKNIMPFRLAALKERN